jgi:hypothetical protein
MLAVSGSTFHSLSTHPKKKGNPPEVRVANPYADALPGVLRLA